MPPTESEEEVKEVKGLKILSPNKPLTRLLVSLAQIKTGINSYKPKTEIRQILNVIVIMGVYTDDNKLTMITELKLLL